MQGYTLVANAINNLYLFKEQKNNKNNLKYYYSFLSTYSSIKSVKILVTVVSFFAAITLSFVLNDLSIKNDIFTCSIV